MKNKKSVSAVVASYNEAPRIGNVLKVLTNSNFINEVIVVDDGSKDNTSEIVKNFPKVKYLRNKVNMGKGYSMKRGVKNSKSEIIFFCDADLKGFSNKIIEEILTPVFKEEVDMSIGIRNNFTQKTWKFFANLSGERALKKQFWKKIPDFYKYGYRIEVGLNSFVKIFGKGFKSKLFKYYQTHSEVKRGFIDGNRFRWRMYYGVFLGYFRFNLYDRFRKFNF